jgi:amino acid permease
MIRDVRPSIGSDENVWQQNWTLISAAVVLLPVVLLKTLGEIAPLSALGMAASIATVVVVVVISAKVTPVRPDSVNTSWLPLPDEFANSNKTEPGHKFVGKPALLAEAFSAIILSFGGHAVFPSLEAGLRDRRQFPAVLNSAYVALLV